MDKIQKIWWLLVVVAIISNMVVLSSNLRTSRPIDTTPNYKICVVHPKGEMGFIYGTTYTVPPDEDCNERFEGLEDMFEVMG